MKPYYSSSEALNDSLARLSDKQRAVYKAGIKNRYLDVPGRYGAKLCEAFTDWCIKYSLPHVYVERPGGKYARVCIDLVTINHRQFDQQSVEFQMFTESLKCLVEQHIPGYYSKRRVPILGYYTWVNGVPLNCAAPIAQGFLMLYNIHFA